MLFTISVEDYKTALTCKSLSDSQRKMLTVHYEASRHNITASELAKRMSFVNYNLANLFYGKLGRIIGERLELKDIPETLPEKIFVSILATFEKPLLEWHWIMRPELARALEELGWVNNEITSYFPEEINNTGTFFEGSLKKITVNAYERNREAREKCIKFYGCICQVCGIDLCNNYGEIAKGYIHIHHLKPLSQIGEEYEINPDLDLIPVCPNCHAVIHMSSPPYTIEEMRKIVAKKYE